jgi:hypothetical protein
VILWALMACRTTDPELDSRRTALDAWQEGVAALDRKDPAAATAAFDRALAARPDDALLMAWKAKAAADAGDLDEAVLQVSLALAEDETLAAARYDRAAWRARKGDVDAAAKDLADAIASGVIRTPRDILDDPDFATALQDPAFAAVVPPDPLRVSIHGPDGAVFLGSDVDIALTVLGSGPGTPIAVAPEAATGPLRLSLAVEDQVQSLEGPARVITWRFVVLGAGSVDVGPFHVDAGPRSASAPKLHVDAMAPPDRPGVASMPLPFTTPGEIANRRDIPSAHWSSLRGLVVLSGPNDQVDVAPPPAGDPIRYEGRDGGARVWVGLVWPTAEPGAKVKVTRQGQTLLEATASAE